MNRGWLAAGAVAVCVAIASCATLPTSGSIPTKPLQDNGVQGQTGVQVDPVPPGPNWSPKEIVQGFLAASANFAHHHRIARDYLTVGFARTWRPGWGATVVGYPAPVQTPIPHNVVTGGPQRAAVTVGGRRYATLLTEGQDQAGSVVVTPASTVFHFSLVLQDGQWRIEGVEESVGGRPSKPAPDSLLLLSKSDFERDYLARNIYFFPAGNSSSSSLVPDPVYIPQTGLVSEVRGLVSALLQPRCRSRRETAGSSCPTNPPSGSWLFGAAETAFPVGVRTVRRVQVIGGVKAIVDLGNTAAKTSPAQRRRMAAQLAWSLTESAYGAQTSQIRSVVLQFGDRSMTASLQPGWVPRTEDQSLYYQIPGHILLRAPTSSQPPFRMTLPRQLAGSSFSVMAVSPVPQLPNPQLWEAVLAGCIGKKLYLIPHSAPQDVTIVPLPHPCASLSWDKAGNLWIALAAMHGTFEIPGARNMPAHPALVQVTIPPLLALPKATWVSTWRVAPDGVRVAMIERSGDTRRIIIGAISRNSPFTYIAQTSGMLRVGSDLQHPIALSWLDPDHLLVLDGGGKNEIFEVPLNGGPSTAITTPPGVTSLSAIWPQASQIPQVVVGIGGSGKVEISQGSLLNPDWRPAGAGTLPVFPG